MSDKAIYTKADVEALLAIALAARDRIHGPLKPCEHPQEWRSVGICGICLADFGSMASRDVIAERQRQQSKEGWSPRHDDDHDECELAKAGIAYAMSAAGLMRHAPTNHPWPWDQSWWKPQNPRRDLVRAAALLIAEIERLDRLPPSAGPKP